MNCLYCNSPHVEKSNFLRPTIFNKRQFTYFKCKDCHTISIDPTPTEAEKAIMFSPVYHKTYYPEEVKFEYPEIFALAEKYNSTCKSLLDFGCGNGSFLSYFKEKGGYECTGIDYGADLINQLQRTYPGIHFYTSEQFSDADIKEKFSIIHLGDVLSHIDRPNDLIQHLITRYLDKEGIMIVEGPMENNFHLALVFRKLISGVYSFFFKKKMAGHIPYHLTFTTADGQKKLFEKNGLHMVYWKVFETAWPYNDKPGNSIASVMKYAIAKLSIFISNHTSANFGNRFIYIGRNKA